MIVLTNHIFNMTLALVLMCITFSRLWNVVLKNLEAFCVAQYQTVPCPNSNSYREQPVPQNLEICYSFIFILRLSS